MEHSLTTIEYIFCICGILIFIAGTITILMEFLYKCFGLDIVDWLALDRKRRQINKELSHYFEKEQKLLRARIDILNAEYGIPKISFDEVLERLHGIEIDNSKEEKEEEKHNHEHHRH